MAVVPRMKEFLRAVIAVVITGALFLVPISGAQAAGCRHEGIPFSHAHDLTWLCALPAATANEHSTGNKASPHDGACLCDCCMSAISVGALESFVYLNRTATQLSVPLDRPNGGLTIAPSLRPPRS
jgi:hypothetical protein